MRRSALPFVLACPGLLTFPPAPPPPRPAPSLPHPHPQCGDLNLVSMLHMVWILAVCQGYSNHAINCMAGCKLLWAYAGQMSHRMAHTAPSERPWWAVAAQGSGVFVSPKLHSAHHATYDDGFPILNGFTAPIIAFLTKAMPVSKGYAYAWLALFAVASLTDVFVLAYAAKAVLGMQ